MSTVVRGVLWVKSCARLRFSSDVVILDVLAFHLGLLVAVVSFRFAVHFFFPRVMLSRFLAPSHMLVLRGRGCCSLRVCGFSVWHCGSMHEC